MVLESRKHLHICFAADGTRLHPHQENHPRALRRVQLNHILALLGGILSHDDTMRRGMRRDDRDTTHGFSQVTVSCGQVQGGPVQVEFGTGNCIGAAVAAAEPCGLAAAGKIRSCGIVFTFWHVFGLLYFWLSQIILNSN